MSETSRDVESGTGEDDDGTTGGSPTTPHGVFSKANIRRAFIQKVYGILAAQLFLTFAMSLGGMYIDSFKAILLHPWVVIIALIVQFAMIFILCCGMHLLRIVPWNYIILGVWTVAMSVSVACACIYSDEAAVAIAVGLTFVATLTVSLLSIWTSFDFTKLSHIMLILGLMLMLVGIVCCFVPNKTLQTIYAGLGVIVMMAYLAYDTQLIMGGRTFQLSEEDYILAVFKLYIDIINLFMFILKLMNQMKGR